MTKLFLDIETLPTDRTDVREFIASTVKPPATMSKAETIAKWEAESKAGAIDEAVAKTGLDGSFGRVCVIGWSFDDEDVFTAFSDCDERDVLERFAEIMNLRPLTTHYETTVVGHNVSAFDLRFLTQRFIVNGIKPPLVIQRAAQAKPWESDKVFDTMVQWAGVGNRISLDKLCLALGIPSPKGDMDGSMVAECVAAGRIAEVAAYCEKDVAAARAVHQRMTFAEV